MEKKNARRIVLQDNTIGKSTCIGRIYNVHLWNSEYFFLRILLSNINGPTSFEYLKTFDNKIWETIRESCIKHGLLMHDKQWEHTLKDAIISNSPYMLRNLFAVMIHQCEISEPMRLWNLYKENLSEYFFI